MRQKLAFLIHFLTASGGCFALLATISAANRQWSDMFLWLIAAQVVDSVDGPLARHFELKKRFPSWDGSSLDFVIDYATYVFIPAFALAHSNYFPEPYGYLLAFVIVLTGGLYFADDSMKTESNAFLGFPAVWNCVIFYLFLFEVPVGLGGVVILILAAAQFFPLDFVHPVRVRKLRWISIALTFVWLIISARVILADMQATSFDKIVLVLTGAYFFFIGMVLQFMRKKQANAS
ncbi:CDP-alcohol phosphatidyltransferase family protein [uncultured Cohaesibacter sp.]|uniref:CDP-alcohol phosphatidyltransferase family protein n=1 Tax=uncultured Cohaesibacter sp. TaxID=1002546 RepID=UPI0029C8B894|nr:CDP-alcohol phosphatidyltransferase family protein [uncultured Cohaesibacter sp.]